MAETAEFERLRRIRGPRTLRRLVQETRLDPRKLIQPLFVQEGLSDPTPIESMPGCVRLGPRHLAREAEELVRRGVGGVLLFGLPSKKDDAGSAAWAVDGIVQESVRRLRDATRDLTLVTDVCLCEYTSTGHCGIVKDSDVDNDATLPLLARVACSHAEAGADMVAPSAMMDGQVTAIRAALDRAGQAQTPILSYSAKHASAFYGPFRDAAGSTPRFGDRAGYQMDPANAREAQREIASDVAQGADAILVKPGLPCLDILMAARRRFDLPIGAYQVSGEYAMIQAAAARGWLDGPRAMMESLTALARAGADFIVTYYAKEASQRIQEER